MYCVSREGGGKGAAMCTVHRSVWCGWLVLEICLNTGSVMSLLAAQSFLSTGSLTYKRYVHFEVLSAVLVGYNVLECIDYVYMD